MISRSDYIVCQLYASLYEWRTGEHHAIGFSANMFLDVYLGHVNTLMDIEKRNTAAFHRMMSEIYTKAGYVGICCPYVQVGMTGAICQRRSVFFT